MSKISARDLNISNHKTNQSLMMQRKGSKKGINDKKKGTIGGSLNV